MFWLHVHFRHKFPIKIATQNPQKSTRTTKAWSLEIAFSCLRCRKNRFWHSHAAWQAFFFDRHAAWECDLSLLQHLPSENAIFSLLPHVPSEKLENHENRILESCCGRVGAKDAKSKSPPKSILPSASTNGTLFLTSAKIELVYEELCIFRKEYT